MSVRLRPLTNHHFEPRSRGWWRGELVYRLHTNGHCDTKASACATRWRSKSSIGTAACRTKRSSGGLVAHRMRASLSKEQKICEPVSRW